MINVSIVGAGRVGGALALSLPKDKYSVQNLIYRGSPETAEQLVAAGVIGAGVAKLDDISMIDSDVVFITTQDSEIAEVAEAEFLPKETAEQAKSNQG